MGLRVASIYLPNGNPIGTEKFAYKLRWLERLRRHAAGLLLDEDEPLVLGGDYNVIPEPRDATIPRPGRATPCSSPESRRAFRGLLNLGLVDAVRALDPRAATIYSFWDYQRAPSSATTASASTTCCSRPAAADRLEAAWVDKDPRARPKASDHTPVLVQARSRRDRGRGGGEGWARAETARVLALRRSCARARVAELGRRAGQRLDCARLADGRRSTAAAGHACWSRCCAATD